MDKYEFGIKIDQMKKLAQTGDYETAMKIADSVDWRRVSNVSLLSLVSEIYEKNSEYGEAKAILLLAFEKAPIGKGLLYKLTQLATLSDNIEEAEAYYKEFYDLAPDDPRQYLLRYMILRQKGVSIDQLIHTLESYNRAELDEKWMYELAELYHEAGQSDDCVRMCDNIMLMFGLGKFVDKAITLKTEKEGRELTEYQQGLIDNRDHYVEKLQKVAQEYGTLTDDSYGVNQNDAEVEEELPQEENDAENADLDGEIDANLQELSTQEELAKEISGIHKPSMHDSETEKTKVYDSKDEAGEGSDKGSTVNKKADKDEKTNKPAAEKIPAEKEDDEDELIPEDLDEELDDDDDITRNSVIEAKNPQEGLDAAVARLKEIHQKTGIKNPAAKIKAGKLNIRGVLASADKIAGRDLIIEEAGDLNEESAAQLLTLVSRDAGERTILLVDNPLQIHEMTKRFPDLARAFHAPIAFDAVDSSVQEQTSVKTAKTVGEVAGSIASRTEELNNDSQFDEEDDDYQNDEIEESQDTYSARSVAEGAHKPLEDEMEIDDFAKYAGEYALSIDCTIPGKSMLALYERIEVMEEENIPLTKSNAEALIEEAADKAEKPPLFKKLFSSQYNKEGLLILKEEHFI